RCAIRDTGARGEGRYHWTVTVFEYGRRLGTPLIPAAELRFTIAAGVCASFTARAKAWHMLNVPSRLTDRTFRQSSGSVSRTLPTPRMPALLTSPWSFPNRRIAPDTNAATWSRSAT